MIEHGVVLFYTTSSVMRAEKLLKTMDYTIKLIPTPRQFSSDCGISLRFDWNHREKVKSILDESKVEFDTLRFLDEEVI
ncbi:DUF3343 domain-containing protein [Chloroflexota bacterium]